MPASPIYYPCFKFWRKVKKHEAQLLVSHYIAPIPSAFFGKRKKKSIFCLSLSPRGLPSLHIYLVIFTSSRNRARKMVMAFFKKCNNKINWIQIFPWWRSSHSRTSTPKSDITTEPCQSWNHLLDSPAHQRELNSCALLGSIGIHPSRCSIWSLTGDFKMKHHLNCKNPDCSYHTSERMK